MTVEFYAGPDKCELRKIGRQIKRQLAITKRKQKPNKRKQTPIIIADYNF